MAAYVLIDNGTRRETDDEGEMEYWLDCARENSHEYEIVSYPFEPYPWMEEYLPDNNGADFFSLVDGMNTPSYI